MDVNPPYYIWHRKVFWHRAEEVPGETQLLLGMGCVIDGDYIDPILTSIHRFSDCSIPYLKRAIQENSMLPFDGLTEEVEWLSEEISEAVASLIRECAGIAGLRQLQVRILVNVRDEEEWLANEMEEEEEEEEEIADEEALRKEGMRMMEKEQYDGGEEEAQCSICLKELSAGEELARTPCDHRFHPECIERWFIRSGSCPLCRFVIFPVKKSS